MKQRITYILVFIFFIPSAYSQKNNIIIGSIETNIEYDDGKTRLNKSNPYVGILHFYKQNGTWSEINLWDSFYFRKYEKIGQVNFFSRGKKFSSNNLSLDTSIYRRPFHYFPYRLAKLVFPQDGNKTKKFSWNSDFKVYRPQLFSNAKTYHKNFTVRYIKSTNNDNLSVINFLIKLAKEKKLGKIKPQKLILKSYSTLFINDTCRIITVDVNLNMFCFEKNIPFDFPVDSIGYSVWTSELQEVTARYKKTYHYSFLKTNKTIRMIGTSMNYFDNMDFDNDGYDEIFLRGDEGDNYTGYVMITDKLSKIYFSGWSYH